MISKSPNALASSLNSRPQAPQRGHATSSRPSATNSLARRTKRLLDVTLAVSGLIAASPLLIIIAAAIRLSMGPPVLFRQARPGYKGKPFELVKFRTMSEVSASATTTRRPLDRVTRLGSLLRRSSLDELPEMWNVLRGEMSIVGPRPLLMEFLDYYTPEQSKRHDVRPGMTGWAQVHGRRDVQMQERIELDLWYVDHWSLRLDTKILLTTVGQVARGTGSEPARAVATKDLGWTKVDHQGEPDDGTTDGYGEKR